MGGLTLSDIERWDPTTVHQVFGDAMRRAIGSRDAAARVYNLTTFSGWSGDAADAARDSATRIMVDLNAHADSCEAVAKAAKAAAVDIEAVKSQLRQIKGQLAYGITLDETTATVLPPPAIASRQSAGEIKAKVDLLQRALNHLMDLASEADDELAAAIRAADGAASPQQVDEQAGADSAVHLYPPTSKDPAAVKKWWDSLTPRQQVEAVTAYGDEIGNLDGVPSQVRSQVNIMRLSDEIARQEAIASYRPLAGNGWPDPRYVEPVANAQAKLNDLYAIRDTLLKHPEAGLLLLDTASNPGRVLAATFVGDIDNAKNVSVTTPGMNTRVSSSMDGMTGEAIALRNQAQELAHGDIVASIAWIGYETTGLNFDVANDGLAQAGAERLNHLYRGLAATTNLPDQHLTALGHSYGSLTTSLALQHGSPVDDVVLYGSPGGEISDASQLKVGPGHAYYEVAQDDAVAIGIANTQAYDGQLQDVPGMIPLSTAPGVTHAPGAPCTILDGATGHSEYPRLGNDGIHLRTSGYNMAGIVAGNPQAVVDNPSPPQTIPGPFGIPISNPDYHS